MSKSFYKSIDTPVADVEFTASFSRSERQRANAVRLKRAILCVLCAFSLMTDLFSLVTDLYNWPELTVTNRPDKLESRKEQSRGEDDSETKPWCESVATSVRGSVSDSPSPKRSRETQQAHRHKKPNVHGSTVERSEIALNFEPSPRMNLGPAVVIFTYPDGSYLEKGPTTEIRYVPARTRTIR